MLFADRPFCGYQRFLPYTVRQGDTIGRIARRFGVNPASVLAVNPSVGCRTVLAAGMLLVVPEPVPVWYAVQREESADSVAAKLGVPPAALAALNPGLAAARLAPGQVIRIPPSAGCGILPITGEYGYRETEEDIGRLRARYPFLRAHSYGRSVRGRALPALRIGSGPARVQVNASFHANEWITGALLMRFVGDLLADMERGAVREGTDVRGLMERVTLWALPIVNPDGVELAIAGADPGDPDFARLIEWNRGSRDFSQWKANIRGVDLNDQFPAHWEEERDRRGRQEPGPRDYGGPGPLSEPEARALYAFTRTADFHMAMALHTQGEEIYWNYRDREPAHAEALAARLSAASGYRAVKLSGSDAGFKDWFIQAYGRPGFTVEAGTGSNPLPVGQFQAIYDKLFGLLFEGLRMMAEDRPG